MFYFVRIWAANDAEAAERASGFPRDGEQAAASVDLCPAAARASGQGEGGQEIHRKPLKTLDLEKEMKGNANVGRVIRRSDSAPARRRKVLQITMAGVWA